MLEMMDRAHHRERIQQRSEHEENRKQREVRTIAEPADPRPPARIGELEAGRADGQPDVVVRTRLHAVEAKRAVDVADLGWQVEAKLTPALQDHLRGFNRAASGDAIRCPASLTRGRLAYPQLERRHGRGHEVELADWAEMLAERRALEDRVDRQRGAEVGEHEIRRGARQCPQVEELVGEEHAGEEHERQPLAAQALRPEPRRRVQPASPVAHEDERTPGAEEVAGGEQRHDQQATVMDPGEHRRQIARCDVGPKESVENNEGCRPEQPELHRRPGMPPPQKPANHRPAKHIHARSPAPDENIPHEGHRRVRPGQPGQTGVRPRTVISPARWSSRRRSASSPLTKSTHTPAIEKRRRTL